MVHVYWHCMTMMAVLFLIKASDQCYHGEVRLVDGCVPNEGRVEVCACMATSCSWGTVCDDFWGERDAQVVCRQLGYGPDGAQALIGAHFGQGCHIDIVLDNVRCNAREAILLECNHNGLFTHNCHHREDAGVRCTGDVDSSLLSESVTNVSVNITSIISTHGTNLYTVLITWKLQNTSWYQHLPNSLQIGCFNHQHRIEMSVNYTTFSIHLVGLLPSTLYNCCVSAVYESYTAKGVCITIPPNETTMIQPDSPCNTLGMASSSSNTIGGVLGFIIAVLLILLAISGTALVYLLRPKFLNVAPKVNSTESDVPVRRNLSYATTPLHSTGSGSQATQATRAAGQSETDAAADYSRVGPSYQTVDSRGQQPAETITGRDRVSARLSERYEFSEAHLAAAGGSDSARGVQGDMGVSYEVPQNLRQIEEHEEYSHLQH